VATPALAPPVLNPAGIQNHGADRRAFLGFFLIGVLLAIPGAALPAWDYHLQPPYLAIGFHFLSFAIGILLSLRTSTIFLHRFGAHRLLAASLLMAALGIILVEFSAPPSPQIARHLSLGIVGLAQGAMMAATLQLLRRLYERDPAATINLAGGLMGLGSLLTALLGALAYSWTEFDGLFILLALAPFGAAAWFFRQGFPVDSEIIDLGFKEVLTEARSPVHVLFACLLFFETAAEVSVLQWAALHLILRSGMSPSAAMYFLSFGRFVAQALLQRFPHRRLLLVSAGMSWLGILIFGSTNNFLGAVMGLSLSAIGFSFIYPLLVERIGSRFREFHSSLFHGIFGIGMLGGFLAPAVIAFWANLSSESSAMTVPLWCSLMVFLLLLMLWVEAKISGIRAARS
jgi:fucose permease